MADPTVDDETAAHMLAAAIEKATTLRPSDVQEIGLRRFDPAAHFTALATRS
jgi:hypothetical protein